MFGNKIKAFGLKKYASLTDLAEALGILPQQLYSYTGEARKPGFETLQRLYTLGCDINWVLDNTKSIDDEKSNDALSKDEIEDIRALLKASRKSKKAAG